MIRILDSNLNRLGVIKNALTASHTEELNGQSNLDFTAILDAKLTALIANDTIFEINDDYFDLAVSNMIIDEDDKSTIEVESDHVSYRLNNPDYNLEYFTAIGSPSDILDDILSGTDFEVGTVEFGGEVTYSAQEAMSRRQLLMEFAAYINAEVKFNKFEISLLTHIGSVEPKAVIKNRNVKVISKSIDKRKLDENRNPAISYTCTPIHLPLDDYAIGDNILLMQKSMGINEILRVVSITYNPYDDMDTTFKFSSYTAGLASSLYQIATSAVSKDKLYNGCRIGPEFGFEAIRNDKMARAYFRSDGLVLQTGDGSGTTWTDKLYYTYDSELDETILVFDGTFTVAVLEALAAVITPVLYAQKGYISELTVDRLETSDKVQRYLDEDTSDVNFIRIEDQVVQFITASVDPQANPNFEQVESRNGEPLYWIDEEKTAASIEETAWPVNVYIYIDTVKMENTFEYDSEQDEYVPRISLGLSDDPSSNGTGAIYKGKEGLRIDYNSTDGELRQILMNDAGIIFTPLAPIGTMAITADRIATDTKIQRFLDFDVSPVNYISIVDQVIQFITANVDAGATPPFVQVVNRDGQPLYWFDDTNTGITTDETEFPVNSYVYTELVKMEQAFYYDEEQTEYIPRLIIGAGNDNGDNAKGMIYKDAAGEGLHIEYYKSDDGELRQITLNDEGIIFDPAPLARDENGDPQPLAAGHALNVASTSLEITISETGDFESEEWTHGYDTSVDNVTFLTTPIDYDSSVIELSDVRVIIVTDTTCKIVGKAIVL